MPDKTVEEIPPLEPSRRNPLMLVVDRVDTRGREPTPEWRLRLAQALQSSLEAHSLFEMFSAALHEIVPHCGLRYVNEELALTVRIGEEAPQTKAYRLTNDSDDLGTLSIWRRNRFKPRESELLELLIADVILPLRNAIMYRRAVKMAALDPLTQVNNRSQLDDMLRREIGLARRHITEFSLLMIDIDHFKAVNDRFGHLAGDNTLQAVARCLVNCARDGDSVYRYGGEEFCILLSNTDVNGAARLAERIRGAVSELVVTHRAGTIRVTVSIGVTSLQKADDSRAFLDRADAALYCSKRDGRNLVTVGI